MIIIIIFFLITFIISIIIRYKYTTIRYNYMMYLRSLKQYIKKNDIYILNILNKLNFYINNIITFFESNLIIQELIQSNKIPIRFIILLKNTLNMLSKLIVFIINKIK